MTAEELAEIRKRLPTSNWKQMALDLDLVLYHTDAQARRITKLEAQLAARWPDREALVAHFRSRVTPPFAAPETLAQEGFIERWKVRADKKAREEADALLSSGALATAQAEQPKWYVGSMNDAAFILDGPPSPSGTDVEPHERENNPNSIACLGADFSTARAIVEAHNATLSSPAATAQAVTLTEEEKNYLAAMDVSPSTNVATLQYDVLNLRRIVTRLTGASTP